MRYKNKDKYDKAIKEYVNDETTTLTYLAKKYNFNRATFSTYLKRNGIPIRKPGRSKEVTGKYLESLKLYNQGYSINQIHHMNSICRISFSKFLKSNGIEVRDVVKKQKIEVDESYKIWLAESPLLQVWDG